MKSFIAPAAAAIAVLAAVWGLAELHAPSIPTAAAGQPAVLPTVEVRPDTAPSASSLPVLPTIVVRPDPADVAEALGQAAGNLVPSARTVVGG